MCTLVHLYTYIHTYQGEMIDCIEHNVENAPVYVERDDFSCVRTKVHYKRNQRVSIAVYAYYLVLRIIILKQSSVQRK